MLRTAVRPADQWRACFSKHDTWQSWREAAAGLSDRILNTEIGAGGAGWLGVSPTAEHKLAKRGVMGNVLRLRSHFGLSTLSRKVGALQLAGGAAARAELEAELAVGAEALHALVVRVGHDDPA